MNTAVRGYFCIVQYCPDIARLEAVNIGVLLFSPEHGFLEAQMSSEVKRVNRFFKGAADLPGHFATMKSALAERLKVERAEFRTLEDLQRFVDTRANRVILTQPKAVRVTDPQADLDRLYAQLVEEPGNQPVTKAPRVPTLRTQLDGAFSRPELAGKIRRRISVEVPMLRRTLEVPYGYQNGRFNLIQPVHFPQKTLESITDHACQFAVEGDSIFRHRDVVVGEMQLVVFADFIGDVTGGQDAVQHLLNQYHVRLYTPENLAELEQDIVQHGKILT